jgi:hypothetical protein
MCIRRRSVLIAVALVAALLCHLHRAPVVLAQLSAAADGEGIVLHGRVLADDGSTTPLPGARVSVVAGGRATVPVASDGEGRFTVSATARDGWSLRVTKAGFAPADIVVAHPAAGPIAIRLAPGAVITGHVVDERGAPVPGVTVHAWPERCPDVCQTPVPLPCWPHPRDRPRPTIGVSIASAVCQPARTRSGLAVRYRPSSSISCRARAYLNPMPGCGSALVMRPRSLTCSRRLTCRRRALAPAYGQA